MGKNWQGKSLGEVVKISKGKKLNSLVDSKTSGSKRFIQIDDLRNSDDLKYTEDKSGVLVSEKDVLIAWDGANAGTVGFGLDGFIGSTIARLEILNESVSTNYFGWYLRTKSKYLRDNSTGATIPHINKSVLESLKILLPPLPIQKQIAEILEQADKAKQKRKEANKLTDEFLQSVFIEMFGDPVKNPKQWEKLKVSDLVEVRGRVGWKGYKKTDLRNSGPYVLGATHLSSSGYLNLSQPIFVSREKFEESPEIVVNKNDLLIVQRGNTIGKVALVTTNIKEATINPCILILRPIKVNPYFLKQYLMHKKVLQKLWNMNSSSAQPMLTQLNIKSFEIYYPPLPLQQQFAAIVNKTEVLKEKQKQSEQELENLFQSLMQKAFKGDLVS